jgi:hypothetical protein
VTRARVTDAPMFFAGLVMRALLDRGSASSTSAPAAGRPGSGAAIPEGGAAALSPEELRRRVREAGREFMAEHAELMARLAK